MGEEGRGPFTVVSMLCTAKLVTERSGFSPERTQGKKKGRLSAAPPNPLAAARHQHAPDSSCFSVTSASRDRFDMSFCMDRTLSRVASTACACACACCSHRLRIIVSAGRRGRQLRVVAWCGAMPAADEQQALQHVELERVAQAAG